MTLFFLVSVCRLLASRPRNNEQLRGLNEKHGVERRKEGSKAEGCKQRREEGSIISVLFRRNLAFWHTFSSEHYKEPLL